MKLCTSYVASIMEFVNLFFFLDMKGGRKREFCLSHCCGQASIVVYFYTFELEIIQTPLCLCELFTSSLFMASQAEIHLPLLLSFVPPVCPALPSPCAAASLSLSVFPRQKPQGCTRAADKDTNTNWQPLGQARMVETVSVAGGRNSRKRTNTVLLLPT